MSRDMTSNRPYIIRALYEWLLDNDCTPQLLVDAEVPGVDVPRQYVQDGRIVFNISPRAVEGLQLGNDQVTFLARFSGVSQMVSVPVHAVLAVYARENGRGMMFDEDKTPPPDDPEPTSTPPGRPSLKVVK